ncbi:7979_t:CDS:2 [Funneliformis mosseae]|uniref:7979_t:CDS:1 n=1 Tax=Funneliformis mosseae TaxID=27381 RepID=A0A9N8ZX30_FUNMO|nr:7979_t:CDS:2 [Funneliformis mosseae]
MNIFHICQLANSISKITNEELKILILLLRQKFRQHWIEKILPEVNAPTALQITGKYIYYFETSVSNTLGGKLPNEKMGTSVASQASIPFTTSSSETRSSNRSRHPISILPKDLKAKTYHWVGAKAVPFPIFKG